MNIVTTIIRQQLETVRKVKGVLAVHLKRAGHEDHQPTGVGRRLQVVLREIEVYALEGKAFNFFFDFLQTGEVFALIGQHGVIGVEVD